MLIQLRSSTQFDLDKTTTHGVSTILTKYKFNKKTSNKRPLLCLSMFISLFVVKEPKLWYRRFVKSSAVIALSTGNRSPPATAVALVPSDMLDGLAPPERMFKPCHK